MVSILMQNGYYKNSLLTFLLFTLNGFASGAATTSTEIKPWPAKIIPYSFEKVPKDAQEVIQKAINRINLLGIVSFSQREATEETNFTSVIFVSKDSACESAGFGWGGESSRIVRVSSVCTYGNILHELLHTLGMVHEQLNPSMKFPIQLDRVAVDWEDQYIGKNAVALTEHDVHSIMHYHSFVNSICSRSNSSKWKDLPADRLPHSSCNDKDWQNLRAENNNGVDCWAECPIFLDPIAGPFGGERIDLSPLDIQGLHKLYPSL